MTWAAGLITAIPELELADEDEKAIRREALRVSGLFPNICRAPPTSASAFARRARKGGCIGGVQTPGTVVRVAGDGRLVGRQRGCGDHARNAHGG